MSSQYFGGVFKHLTSNSAITDLTPPTFDGITFLDVESRGQIRAGWSSATESLSTPVRYEVYIKASTSTGLFNVTNIVAITPNLSYDIFTLPDGSFLQNGTTYYVGIRAFDAVGNRETNTVSMNVISTGVLTSIDVYRNNISKSIDSQGRLLITAWVDKNSTLVTPSSGGVLGTAAYQVYDSSGTAISGLSGSGISANAQGLFVFNPVATTIDERLHNYQVKVTITVDGEARVNMLPLSQQIPKYDLNASFTIDRENMLVGSFWVTCDGNKIEDSGRINSGHYHVHDIDGSPVSGMTESGIAPNADGLFVITPVTSTLQKDSTIYFVHVRMSVDGTEIDQVIPLAFENPIYEVKAIFSINALNQLMATLWVTADGQAKTTNLGTASYTIYDATGAAVSGLSQSGITADANGRFTITPISAALLSDLTHYSAKITIVADEVARTSYKGFTLLGT